MGELASKRKKTLKGAYQVQKFIRAGDETKSWMSEKETALLSDDYGRDLASVQALQRKHEGLERDLDALEEKVKLLGLDSAQLIGAQPKSGRVVRDKEKEIVDSWSTLKSRVSGLIYHYNLALCVENYCTRVNKEGRN